MLRANSWLLDPPFFTVKVLRKLTGILEEPGILGNYWEDVLGGLSNVGIMLQISGCVLMLRFKKWDSCIRTALHPLRRVAIGRGDESHVVTESVPEGEASSFIIP
jgi:hypothetical protein